MSLLYSIFPPQCSVPIQNMASGDDAAMCAHRNLGFYIASLITIVFLIILLYNQYYKTAAVVAVIAIIVYVAMPYINRYNWDIADYEIKALVTREPSLTRADAIKIINDRNNANIIAKSKSGPNITSGLMSGVGFAFGSEFIRQMSQK